VERDAPPRSSGRNIASRRRPLGSCGGTTWVRWEIRPWWNTDGLQGGIIIFAEDITHYKQTEEALFKVNQKLIRAHEDERKRIARELHDDISQRIALLAMKLEGVPRSSSVGD
jgi:signal transduction histidine kinase